MSPPNPVTVPDLCPVVRATTSIRVSVARRTYYYE